MGHCPWRLPWCWYINANIDRGFLLIFIHGAPYIAAPWIRHGFMKSSSKFTAMYWGEILGINQFFSLGRQMVLFRPHVFIFPNQAILGEIEPAVEALNRLTQQNWGFQQETWSLRIQWRSNHEILGTSKMGGIWTRSRATQSWMTTGSCNPCTVVSCYSVDWMYILYIMFIYI